MFTIPSLLRLAVYLGSWSSNPYPSLGGYDSLLEVDLRGNDYCSVVREEISNGDYYNGYVAYHFHGYFLSNDPAEYEDASDQVFYLDKISYQIYPYNVDAQTLVSSQPREIIIRKTYDDLFARFANQQLYLHTSFLDDDVAEVVTFDDGDETFSSNFSTNFGFSYGTNYTIVDSRIDESGLFSALTDKMHLYHLEQQYLGYQEGYIEGYNEGYANGVSQDATVVAIFSGILDIGLIPVNMFLTIFNFDILGINVSAFVSALVSAVLIFIMLRSIFSGGNSK